MISGRNNRSAAAYVFTASQWEELEQQLLTFKYLMSGIPVPPELISTLITTYHPFASSSSSSCSSSMLFPNQHTLPFGWGSYNKVGYGRKIDPEPGRCRRTDGKKWRCTKEACPDSKYCERHIHRGKNKSKKQPTPPLAVVPPNSTPLDTTSVILKPPPPPQTTTTTTYPHYCKSQKLHSSSSFYPFLSPNHNHNNNDQPSSYSLDFTESTQHNTAPHWLSDTLPYHHPNNEIRYTAEMKGTSVGERILGPIEDIVYNNINKDINEERFGFDTTTSKDDAITQKQFFHHFLGD